MSVNNLYDFGRNHFLTADGTHQINWLTDNIKLVLVDDGAYTVNLATHQFLSDIPAPARIATSGNLASKTAVAGVADAADVDFASVTGHVAAGVLYYDSGVAGTSILICYSDCGGGLPADPSAQPIHIHWDDDPTRKIFKL